MEDSTLNPTSRLALPKAVRQRLDQLFAHAKRCYEKGDHEYAHDLFTQCVAEDPSNVPYLTHLRANLTKKYGAGKKASSFGSLLSKSSRGVVDKAVGKGNWEEAFTAGCKALKKSPGDLGLLQALAAACGKRGFVETQLMYLKWALDIDATDVESNRQAGMALAEVGEFDQAIACWRRVQQQKPHDEESAKQVARLSVEQTIHKGGYNTDLLKKDGGKSTAGESDPAASPGTARVSDLASKHADGSARMPSGGTTIVNEPSESFEEREQDLLELIAKQPTESGNYLRLAEMYEDEDRHQDAERLLKKGLAASQGADLSIRERLEDVHLRRVHKQVEIAQRRDAKGSTEETKTLVKRMVDQANLAELEVFTERAKRSPGDTSLLFELGLRQKRLAKYREAITTFQSARADSRRAAEIEILLGECFQHIEQYKLAMSSYEAAVKASGDAESDTRKLALYRAGVLAMGLNDWARAEQQLTELAGLDFSYRDVAQRLDKIAGLSKDT